MNTPTYDLDKSNAFSTGSVTTNVIDLLFPSLISSSNNALWTSDDTINIDSIAQ